MNVTWGMRKKDKEAAGTSERALYAE